MENQNVFNTLGNIIRPNINYTPRVLAGNNGTVSGVNALADSLKRSRVWGEAEKDSHAAKLIILCREKQDIALDKMSTAKTMRALNDAYADCLKYSAIALRLIEYRINLCKRYRA